MYEFAYVIIRARIEAHLGLKEFARKAGISDGTIGYWHNGTTLPTTKTFKKIYKTLQKEGCSIETLNDLEYAYNEEKTERELNRANRKESSNSESVPKWDGKAYTF